MGFANSKIEAAFLLSVGLAITVTFLYGLITKPIITYHISTTLNYNETIDFESEILLVNLEAMNKGLSPARVALVVRLYNMSLEAQERIETSEGSEFSEHRISLYSPIRRAGHANYTIKLTTLGNATHLVLIFYVEPPPRWDPIRGFYNSFAVYNPRRPTALLLKHIDGMKFMRVRKR